jgi:hypothetical protein
MFIVSLKYKKPLAEVDAHLPAHVEYLKSQYSAVEIADYDVVEFSPTMAAAGLEYLINT